MEPWGPNLVAMTVRGHTASDDTRAVSEILSSSAVREREVQTIRWTATSNGWLTLFVEENLKREVPCVLEGRTEHSARRNIGVWACRPKIEKRILWSSQSCAAMLLCVCGYYLPVSIGASLIQVHEEPFVLDGDTRQPLNFFLPG